MKKIALAVILLIFAVSGIMVMRTGLDSSTTSKKLSTASEKAPTTYEKVSAASEKLSEKMIVLTFDDGPRPKILFGEDGLFSLLKTNNLPAHFFMVGNLVELHQNHVKFLHQKGFLIENHSYGHENLLGVARLEGQETVLKNIRKTNDIIHGATGRKPKYFRPPYLAINGSIKNSAEREGLVVLSPHKAEINTRDYAFQSKKRPSDELIAYVKKEIALREQAGFERHILLFHELHITTEALKSLIPWFLSQGYQFTTLDNFLEFESHHNLPSQRKN